MTNEIVLTFDFKTPLDAEDLGEVFKALARDYRESSRDGTLVVTRVESGSIIVTLTDAALVAVPYVAGAVTAMAAVNTVAKFAENLKIWFGLAKTDKGKNRLYKKGKKTPGQRSVEAIISTAAKTQSHVKVKYTNADRETLEAELTPAEATRAHEETTVANAEVAKPAVDVSQMLAARPAVRMAIEKLQQAGSENLTPLQIQSFVDIMVSVLKSSGAGQFLPEIVYHLEMHGLYGFATAVKQHIHGQGVTPKPPLTAT